MPKAVAKKAYHTITVRLQPSDHDFLKEVKAREESEQERIVPYTEILIRALRATRPEAKKSLRAAR
jgi:hypothetical protein